MTPEKRWKIRPQSSQISQTLANHLNTSPIIAQLLLNRGISSLSYAQNFLNPSPIETPYPSEKLAPIFEAIQDAIARKTVIFLYGDYDVDGMTSTAMMIKCITALGGTVRYKLPHRFKDGYGLNTGIVDLIKSEQCGLFITLDCGITNVQEIQSIKTQTSATVIVIDHHQIPSPQPNADIILNPKEPGTPSPLIQLCTAGIVYKLIDYIHTRVPTLSMAPYLLLAAIGTVADVVTLHGENRRIVKLGLPLLWKAKNKGINALLATAKWDQQHLSVRDVGFTIAPRLNAAGRLSSAEYGVELLLTESATRAQELASYLETLNTNRKTLDQSVVSDSISLIDGSDHYQNQSILVLGNEGWHAGVIGIAASKLVDIYSKPVVIMGIDKDITRGSARTVGDINIYHLLRDCSDFFLSFGGHKQASGFSLKPKNVPLFQKKLEALVKSSLPQNTIHDAISIDMKLETRDIGFELIDTINTLAPFGQGNPDPLFYSDAFTIIDSRLVGNGKHLKATLHDKKYNCYFDAIGFNLGKKLACVHHKQTHIVFSIGRNNWNNKESIQLTLKDIK